MAEERSYWVELSGENLDLAEAELASLVVTLDPVAAGPRRLRWGERWRAVRSAREDLPTELARRMAFGWRVVEPVHEGRLDQVAEALVREGGWRATGKLEVARGAPGDCGAFLPPYLGKAYTDGGGRIDLEAPERTYIALATRGEPRDPDFELALTREVATVPRGEFEGRRSRELPFRKPVTLPPRLARALVNLAEVPPGGTLLDPFCGTGALLLEAGAIGLRAVGADRDAEMVRGALANLAAHAIVPERMIQQEVARIAGSLEGLLPVGAVATDPPYGRAASTGGEGAGSVLEDLVRALPGLLRPGGRAVMLVPTPDLPPIPTGWSVEGPFEAQRVHRSLTRHWVRLTAPTGA